MRIACRTLEANKSSPNFPIDVFPLELFLVVHVLDEAIEVEVSITYMLSNNLSMEVYKDFCTWTYHPAILGIGVELAAVNASIEDSFTIVRIFVT